MRGHEAGQAGSDATMTSKSMSLDSRSSGLIFRPMAGHSCWAGHRGSRGYSLHHRTGRWGT